MPAKKPALGKRKGGILKLIRLGSLVDKNGVSVMATGVQPHGDRLLWTFHRIECKGHFVTGLSKGTLQRDANVIY